MNDGIVVEVVYGAVILRREVKTIAIAPSPGK
jgi:hypothetical protein